MRLTYENEKEILHWFRENDYEPINLGKLITHLIDNDYIKTSDEVLFENIECCEIYVPSIHYLDKDYIVENDDDYIKIGNDKYLNQYRIIESIYDEFFANDLIKFEKDALWRN